MSTPQVVRERRARLFRNGRNQAVRIPRELELPGREVLLRREGRRLIVEPVGRPSLIDLLATLKPLDENVLAIDRPMPEPVDRDSDPSSRHES
jgi:antitoxin VapB